MGAVMRNHADMRSRLAFCLLLVGVALLATAVLMSMPVGSWWRAVTQAYADHSATAGLATAGVLLVAVAWMLSRRSPARLRETNGGQARSRWLWLLTDFGVAVLIGATICLGLVAMVWMLRVAGDAPTAPNRAALKVEAIKYGLGSVVASGAAAALLLAVRRQRLAESTHELALKAQEHTEIDAAYRRVTDQYTKAVEQLGSREAAVRLGGLYALERLAQVDPDQRQTIVNVICAYLRMHGTSPGVPKQRAYDPATADGTGPGAATVADAGSVRDPRQESQVRMTAQRILTTHLAAPADLDLSQRDTDAPDVRQPFWAGIEVDLTDALLVDWNLPDGRLKHAKFSGATFDRAARFGGTTFLGPADFSRVTFTDTADFDGTSFHETASFLGARFARGAGFAEARFVGTADFGEVTFTGDADFGTADFVADAGFGTAVFAGRAMFRSARFGGIARFFKATFRRRASFEDVVFAGSAAFSATLFHEEAQFTKVHFGGRSWFKEARFLVPPTLNASVAQGAANDCEWPAGWQVEPDPANPDMDRLHQVP
jgi:uncharacterized protein YjbI with pentapeptide repeats